MPRGPRRGHPQGGATTECALTASAASFRLEFAMLSCTTLMHAHVRMHVYVTFSILSRRACVDTSRRRGPGAGVVHSGTWWQCWHSR